MFYVLFTIGGGGSNRRRQHSRQRAISMGLSNSRLRTAARWLPVSVEFLVGWIHFEIGQIRYVIRLCLSCIRVAEYICIDCSRGNESGVERKDGKEIKKLAAKGAERGTTDVIKGISSHNRVVAWVWACALSTK